MNWDEGRQTNHRLRRETRWIEQIVGVQMSERRAAAATSEGRGSALRVGDRCSRYIHHSIVESEPNRN